MASRDLNPSQQQQATPKVAPLPQPRPFTPETAEPETEVAPKLEPGTNPFQFSHVAVGSSDPGAPSPNSNQNVIASPIQAKLTIGEPGDRYEQEADNVARAVVQHINSSDIAIITCPVGMIPLNFI